MGAADQRRDYHIIIYSYHPYDTEYHMYYGFFTVRVRLLGTRYKVPCDELATGESRVKVV